MIYFTSDTHFGHKKIPIFCPNTRPQGVTPEEMDEIMIARWNEVVPSRAEVYHLGDFTFWHSKSKVHEILARLNGRIHLTLGNHDDIIIDNRAEFTGHNDQKDWIGRFASIRDYHEIRFNKQKINLFHFPMAIWHKHAEGAWHLYGHCHGSYPGHGRGKTMDVGWDTQDMWPGFLSGPISFDQIKEVMDSRPEICLNHHNPDSAGRED